MHKILFVAMLISVSLAHALPKAQRRSFKAPKVYKPQPAYQPQAQSFSNDVYEEEPKPYAFDYGVQDQKSGANFGHSETSDGNAVKGSYTVALPDGRIQTVTYTADQYNGFQAAVTYQGEAQYPEYIPEQPSYQQRNQYN